MPTETLSLTPLGQIHDLPPQLVGPDKYTGGYNVIYEDGIARRTEGFVADKDCLFVPTALLFTTINGVEWWLYADMNGVGAWNGATHFDITPPIYQPADNRIS